MPHKVCTLDCLYCECGSTTLVTTERRQWVPTAAVLEELDGWLGEHGEGGALDADYLTFSGAGEPTLHSDLGTIAAWLSARSAVPLALLTNGTLLGDRAIRDELHPFRVICPSLDTAVEETFMAFNRPHASLCVGALVEGLVALRQESGAEIWLEVLLADGVNDSDAELDALAEAIRRIDPHRVQVNTAVRPGTDRRLGPASAETLVRALARFGPRAEPIAGFPLAERGMSSSRGSGDALAGRHGRSLGEHDLVERLVAVLSRRPETLPALALSLGVSEVAIREAVDNLVDTGRLHAEPREGLVYYHARTME